MKRKLAGNRAEPCWEKRDTSWGTAFTLIELLVVIAIIAILAAMLLPGLSRAKAQANSATCKNHLHQMGLALNMYLADNESRFPHLFSYSNSVKVGGMVFTALYSYYPLQWTNTAYHCPGYKAPITDFSGNRTFSIFTGSYGYNDLGTFVPSFSAALPTPSLGLTPLDDANAPAISYASVKVPSEMVAFGDSRLETYNLPGSAQAQSENKLAGCGELFCGGSWPAWSYPERHGKNYNVVCCDGHVEGTLREAFFDPIRTATRWNIDHEQHRETWVP